MAYWRIRQALSVLKNGAKYLQKERSELANHVPFTAPVDLQQETLAIPTRRCTNPFTYKTC